MNLLKTRTVIFGWKKKHQLIYLVQEEDFSALYWSHMFHASLSFPQYLACLIFSTWNNSIWILTLFFLSLWFLANLVDSGSVAPPMCGWKQYTFFLNWVPFTIVFHLQVLSVTLDDWSDDEVDAMIEVGGNSSANAIYEAFIPEGVSKPGPDSSHEIRSKFIRLDFEV